jgi:hypothetical protein
MFSIFFLASENEEKILRKKIGENPAESSGERFSMLMT